MDEAPIGIFDSGLGGLTIVRALADLLPDEHLVYFGDTVRFPYGSKDPESLCHYAVEIADVLLAHGAKMLVVACNSAACVALDELRARYDVPVVGVIEPGVRAGLEVTSGRIGVIGTQATIASGAYERAVAASGRAVQLTTLACPEFVELVESGDLDSADAYALIAFTLAPLRLAAVDTVILGCTHYPHLARAISDVMGRDVVLVSSAEETAFEVRALLERSRLDRRGDGEPPRRRFLTSGDATTFARLGGRFLGAPIAEVATWRWPTVADEPVQRSA